LRTRRGPGVRSSLAASPDNLAGGCAVFADTVGGTDWPGLPMSGLALSHDFSCSDDSADGCEVEAEMGGDFLVRIGARGVGGSDGAFSVRDVVGNLG